MKKCTKERKAECDCVKKRRGRPKGSKNKPKSIHADLIGMIRALVDNDALAERFDYLRCIELCIEYGRRKHGLSDGAPGGDDLLALAKYESCQG